MINCARIIPFSGGEKTPLLSNEKRVRHDEMINELKVAAEVSELS